MALTFEEFKKALLAIYKHENACIACKSNLSAVQETVVADVVQLIRDLGLDPEVLCGEALESPFYKEGDQYGFRCHMVTNFLKKVHGLYQAKS